MGALYHSIIRSVCSGGVGGSNVFDTEEDNRATALRAAGAHLCNEIKITVYGSVYVHKATASDR